MRVDSERGVLVSSTNERRRALCSDRQTSVYSDANHTHTTATATTTTTTDAATHTDSTYIPPTTQTRLLLHQPGPRHVQPRGRHAIVQLLHSISHLISPPPWHRHVIQHSASSIGVVRNSRAVASRTTVTASLITASPPLLPPWDAQPAGAMTRCRGHRIAASADPRGHCGTSLDSAQRGESGRGQDERRDR